MTAPPKAPTARPAIAISTNKKSSRPRSLNTVTSVSDGSHDGLQRSRIRGVSTTETALRHGQAEVVNGVRLHYVEAGAGPLVVLLHGFPEFWYSWRHQIFALSSAGYRVLAPDLRGYNLSDKPPAVADYRVGVLVDDVAGLIRHAGAERATVVGHDWGGVV